MARRMRLFGLLGVLSVVLFLVSACGGDDESGPSGADSGSSEVAAGVDLEGQELVVAGWGGLVHDAFVEAYGEPFEKATGATVRVVDAGGGWVAKVNSQKDSGEIRWDVIDGTPPGDAVALWEQDLLEPIPDELRTELEEISLPGGVSEYGITAADVGVFIACTTEVERCPANAEEFWDVENFPGTRAMTAFPEQVLPFAVRAAGAPRDEIYPIDLDLAFEKLEELKPDVSVWTTSGDQQIQVMRDGEADISFMWSGRAFGLQEQGVEIAVNWEDAVRETSWLTVLKDSPNPEAAMAYLEFQGKNPALQATYTELSTYGGAHEEAADFIAPEYADFVVAGHQDQMITEDGEWFHRNLDEIQRRWDAFLTD